VFYSDIMLFSATSGLHTRNGNWQTLGYILRVAVALENLATLYKLAV